MITIKNDFQFVQAANQSSVLTDALNELDNLPITEWYTDKMRALFTGLLDELDQASHQYLQELRKGDLQRRAEEAAK